MLVQEPEHKEAYWKFPGGKQEWFETTPKQTAIREIEEETGIILREEDLVLLTVIPRDTHCVYLFAGKASSSKNTLKEKGDEGEYVKIFPMKDVFAMDEFFPSHRNFLKKLGVTK